jgi:hypothetical protein
MQTIFAIIVPIMVLTILIMGLVVIPASAASSAAQRVAAMLQQRNSAAADSPGGAHSQARAVPGSGASASAGCTRVSGPPETFASASCGTRASAPVGRQFEREQAAAAAAR